LMFVGTYIMAHLKPFGERWTIPLGLAITHFKKGVKSLAS